MLTIASAQQGDYARAARLAGAFATENVRGDVVLDPPVDALLSRALAPVRAALGEERWAAAFGEGAALSMEQAIAEALADGGDDRADGGG